MLILTTNFCLMLTLQSKPAFFANAMFKVRMIIRFIQMSDVPNLIVKLRKILCSLGTLTSILTLQFAFIDCIIIVVVIALKIIIIKVGSNIVFVIVIGIDWFITSIPFVARRTNAAIIILPLWALAVVSTEVFFRVIRFKKSTQSDFLNKLEKNKFDFETHPHQPTNLGRSFCTEMSFYIDSTGPNTARSLLPP